MELVWPRLPEKEFASFHYSPPSVLPFYPTARLPPFSEKTPLPTGHVRKDIDTSPSFVRIVRFFFFGRELGFVAIPQLFLIGPGASQFTGIFPALNPRES